MSRASISHIALTVSDLNRAANFYDRIFKFMGYMPVEVPESTQQAMKTQLKAWVGPGYSISIRPSKGEFARRLHDRNAPGFNHMAFYAEDRSDIDAMHKLLKKGGHGEVHAGCGLASNKRDGPGKRLRVYAPSTHNGSH